LSNEVSNMYNNVANTSADVAENIENFGSSITLLAQQSANSANQIAESGTYAIKEGISNLAFSVATKTDGLSNTLSVSIVKFGYLFATEPTRISDVKVVVLSPTSTKISWQTNHPASGKVNYGFASGDYIFEIQDDKKINYHEFVLENLDPNTEYHFEVMSQNKNYVYDANRTFMTPEKIQ
jgi:hypothetical protein